MKTLRVIGTILAMWVLMLTLATLDCCSRKAAAQSAPATVMVQTMVDIRTNFYQTYLSTNISGAVTNITTETNWLGWAYTDVAGTSPPYTVRYPTRWGSHPSSILNFTDKYATNGIPHHTNTFIRRTVVTPTNAEAYRWRWLRGHDKMSGTNLVQTWKERPITDAWAANNDNSLTPFFPFYRVILLDGTTNWWRTNTALTTQPFLNGVNYRTGTGYLGYGNGTQQWRYAWSITNRVLDPLASTNGLTNAYAWAAIVYDAIARREQVISGYTPYTPTSTQPGGLELVAWPGQLLAHCKNKVLALAGNFACKSIVGTNTDFEAWMQEPYTNWVWRGIVEGGTNATRWVQVNAYDSIPVWGTGTGLVSIGDITMFDGGISAANPADVQYGYDIWGYVGGDTYQVENESYFLRFLNPQNRAGGYYRGDGLTSGSSNIVSKYIRDDLYRADIGLCRWLDLPIGYVTNYFTNSAFTVKGYVDGSLYTSNKILTGYVSTNIIPYGNYFHYVPIRDYSTATNAYKGLGHVNTSSWTFVNQWLGYRTNSPSSSFSNGVWYITNLATIVTNRLTDPHQMGYEFSWRGYTGTGTNNASTVSSNQTIQFHQILGVSAWTNLVSTVITGGVTNVISTTNITAITFDVVELETNIVKLTHPSIVPISTNTASRSLFSVVLTNSVYSTNVSTVTTNWTIADGYHEADYGWQHFPTILSSLVWQVVEPTLYPCSLTAQAGRWAVSNYAPSVAIMRRPDTTNAYGSAAYAGGTLTFSGVNTYYNPPLYETIYGCTNTLNTDLSGVEALWERFVTTNCSEVLASYPFAYREKTDRIKGTARVYQNISVDYTHMIYVCPPPNEEWSTDTVSSNVTDNGIFAFWKGAEPPSSLITEPVTNSGNDGCEYTIITWSDTQWIETNIVSCSPQYAYNPLVWSNIVDGAFNLTLKRQEALIAYFEGNTNLGNPPAQVYLFGDKPTGTTNVANTMRGATSVASQTNIVANWTNAVASIAAMAFSHFDSNGVAQYKNHGNANHLLPPFDDVGKATNIVSAYTWPLDPVFDSSDISIASTNLFDEFANCGKWHNAGTATWTDDHLLWGGLTNQTAKPYTGDNSITARTWRVNAKFLLNWEGLITP